MTRKQAEHDVSARPVPDRAAEELEDRRLAAEWAAQQADIHQRVMAQCKGELYALRNEEGQVVAEVPAAPFLNWCLWRSSTLRHLAPPWVCVSPVGLKMANDDTYHSDWYFGAGFTYTGRYDYEGEVHKAAMHTMFDVQRTVGHFNCLVVVEGHGRRVKGVVGKEIAVLPNLHPDHMEAVLKSRAVITEAGGAMAHLATIAREQGVPIVMVKGARAKFLSGATVRVDVSSGIAELIEVPTEEGA